MMHVPENTDKKMFNHGFEFSNGLLICLRNSQKLYQNNKQLIISTYCCLCIFTLSNILTEFVYLFVSAIDFYSYLKASTGFLVAALQLCQLTVRSAIPKARKPAKIKIHQLRSVL
jgi:hypothetical protein